MLKVISITDTIISYNGYEFYLGSIGSAKMPEFLACFPTTMEVKEGQYLDKCRLDLTTAYVDGKYEDCVRVRGAEVYDDGELSKYIELPVFGILLKPRNTTEVLKRGMDARPLLRFTLKSRDAFGKNIARPAQARNVAEAILATPNRTFMKAECSIIPDARHGYVLEVKNFTLEV